MPVSGKKLHPGNDSQFALENRNIFLFVATQFPELMGQSAGQNHGEFPMVSWSNFPLN